jgi:hypothetical protein
MPFGDGTGPVGQGSGRGNAMGRRQSRGRMGGNRSGIGPGGNCVCTSCGAKLAHQQGVPCYSMNCPKCGASMMRG